MCQMCITCGLQIYYRCINYMCNAAKTPHILLLYHTYNTHVAHFLVIRIIHSIIQDLLLWITMKPHDRILQYAAMCGIIYGIMRHCMAVCGICVAICGKLEQYAVLCIKKQQYAVLCGNTWQSAAICGNMQISASICSYVAIECICF